MNWTDRRRRLRAILKGDRCYHPASVFDPLSARIAQDLGFEVGMFAGSTASLTVLGAPDLILITLSEFAGQAYRINRAFDRPLLVDADHGYGNALNVMRTVQELETAGVSALTIEIAARLRSLDWHVPAQGSCHSALGQDGFAGSDKDRRKVAGGATHQNL
jgi:oxaloacetate decarboxylase